MFLHRTVPRSLLISRSLLRPKISVSLFSDTVNANGNDNNQPQEQPLETRYKELHKQYLTILADMENLRIRTRKEVEQTSAFSITKFAKDMLNVLDILRSALGSVPIHLRPPKKHSAEEGTQHLEQPPSKTDTSKETNISYILKDLYSGLEMTHNEILHTFKRHGVEPFDSMYTIFDPNLHMALYDVPKSTTQLPESVKLDENVSKHPIVIDEQKQGFKIKDRVLRHAQVGIAR